MVSLVSLDQDPWGHPYKMVLRKLRQGASPITETLDPQLLEIVGALFPKNRDGDTGTPLPSIHPGEDQPGWTEELGVNEEELTKVVKRLRAKNTALGPDGILGRTLTLALSPLADRLGHIYTLPQVRPFPPGVEGG